MLLLHDDVQQIDLWGKDMRKQYTLYLDESETHTHNHVTGKDENYHFCMAGIIIDVNNIPRLDNDIRTLKRTVWYDVVNPEE